MMKRIAIYISEKQYKAFKQFSQREGLPYSELIRRALDEFLRHEPLRHSATNVESAQRKNKG